MRRGNREQSANNQGSERETSQWDSRRDSHLHNHAPVGPHMASHMINTALSFTTWHDSSSIYSILVMNNGRQTRGPEIS